MRKIKILILLCLIVLVALFTNCGKSDTDVEWEERIIGYWKPVNSNMQDIQEIPKYIFLKDNRGASFYEPFNSTDSFGWEIKRGQLKIYYDNPPQYYIGYDNYNTRSLFKIEEFSDTIISIIQFFSTGFQKEYKLKRYYVENEEDNLKINSESNNFGVENAKTIFLLFRKILCHSLMISFHCFLTFVPVCRTNFTYFFKSLPSIDYS